MNPETLATIEQAKAEGETAAGARASAAAMDAFADALRQSFPAGAYFPRDALITYVTLTAGQYRTIGAALAEDERIKPPAPARVDAVVALVRQAGDEPGERAAVLGRLEALGCTSTELRAALAVLA